MYNCNHVDLIGKHQFSKLSLYTYHIDKLIYLSIYLIYYCRFYLLVIVLL